MGYWQRLVVALVSLGVSGIAWAAPMQTVDRAMFAHSCMNAEELAESMATHEREDGVNRPGFAGGSTL